MTESETIARLQAENEELKEQLKELRITEGDADPDQRKQKPIQGMMKLLKNKNRQIQETVEQLEDTNLQLQKSYEQTVNYYKSTITALASAMEAKDPYFNFHSSNVESLCRRIADTIKMEKQDVALLSAAALIHDFGNIGIRSEVLHKQGPLEPDEYEHVKTHPLIASIILEPIGDLDVVITAIKHHHENVDGSGYPDRLTGADIPQFSKIIYIAESFDAITSVRPYREPLEKDMAREEIAAHAGTRYDEKLVEAFLRSGI